MKILTDLDRGAAAIIDLDTGTVHGTNLMVIPWPTDAYEAEEILSNGDYAQQVAVHRGFFLHIEDEVFERLSEDD